MKRKYFQKLLEEYNFILPHGLIARRPVFPQDFARLLVYNHSSKQVSWSIYKDIGLYLPRKSVIVFNDTKVVPARLSAKKSTGGAIEIFYLSRERTLLRCMIGGRVKTGDVLYVNKTIYFEVVVKEGKYALLRPSFSMQKLFSILDKYGRTPMPPYIRMSPLSEASLRKEYQTVFAKKRGSVAAPTASLHFTKKLLSHLKKQGHTVVMVTLHVNLGTFAPLEEHMLEKEKLHKEEYEISKYAADIINKAKKYDRSVVAVGTTVVRALESAGIKGNVRAGRGATDIFIREGFTFKVVSALITNFHLPRSSLLMLVSAFVGRKKVLELYQKAIQKKFRFFSFGDGMLIV